MEILSGVMSVMEEVSLSLGRLREGVWFDHDVPPLARASRFSLIYQVSTGTYCSKYAVPLSFYATSVTT